MDDKDYVGMDLCFYCGEPRGIILNRRLQKTLPRSAVYSKEPCDTCKGFMASGVILIGVRDGEKDMDNPFRTGQFIVVKDEAIQRLPIDDALKSGILKERLCFIEESVLKGLMPEGVSQ